MRDHTIQTKNLTKRFRRRFRGATITAVDHVSLGVERGEILGILGQNGAGKSTTLLKMICGLLRPTEGEILINGRHLEKHRQETLAEIGAVLEGSRNSLWSMTVWQNMRYFGYLKNMYGGALKRRVGELVRLFQLEEKQNELVKNLSKGMKQKLAIAFAFINDPSLVLLDEHLGLDVQTERIVKDLIVHLAKENNKTVLLSSHDMRLVEEICDRVAIISEGKLLRVDETKNLLRNLEQEIYFIRLERTPEFQRLGRIPGVRIGKVHEQSQKEDGCLIRVTMEHHERLFDIIDALRAEGLRVLSITKCEPSLEDVFVNLVKS